MSKTKEITLKNNFKKLNFKSYKGILTFELPVQNLPNEPVQFQGFLPPGSGSLHADPGGLFKCGSATLLETCMFEREKNIRSLRNSKSKKIICLIKIIQRCESIQRQISPYCRSLQSPFS